MKITEIITEADIPANPEKLHNSQVASLKGAVSMPGISMNKANGSAYTQYRFGLALAGAGAGKTPSEITSAAGAFSGDPVLLTYTDEEGEMIKNAAIMVGAGKILPIGDRSSRESPETNTKSPFLPKGPVKRKG